MLFQVNRDPTPIPESDLLCRLSDVANTPEAIAILVLLILQLLIFAVILYYTFLMKKLRAPKSVLVFVYGTMILWATVFTAQYILSLASYKLNSEVMDYQNYSHAYLDIVPRFIVVFDLAAAILIQTLLLIVPYFWIRNIVYFLEHSDEIESKRTKIFNKITKYYIVGSRCIVGGLILSLFFISHHLVIQFNKNMKIFIVVEASITVCYLLFAFWLLRKKLKKVAEVQSFKTILCEGVIIIIICIIRCAQNVITANVFKKIKLRVFEQNLLIRSLFSMIVLLVGIVMMHFIPIIIILYIYKPTSPEEESDRNENNQSLISTS